jgi:hypothetical protein
MYYYYIFIKITVYDESALVWIIRLGGGLGRGRLRRNCL